MFECFLFPSALPVSRVLFLRNQVKVWAHLSPLARQQVQNDSCRAGPRWLVSASGSLDGPYMRKGKAACSYSRTKSSFPDYKALGILKRQFPNTTLIGLTATATSHVLKDAQKILCVGQCLTFTASFNRPNLFYEVHSFASQCSAFVKTQAKRSLRVMLIL